MLISVDGILLPVAHHSIEFSVAATAADCDGNAK
jgi:hypothetical protein